MKKLCVSSSLEGPVASHMALYVRHKIWSRDGKRAIAAQSEEFSFSQASLAPCSQAEKKNLPSFRATCVPVRSRDIESAPVPELKIGGCYRLLLMSTRADRKARLWSRLQWLHVFIIIFRENSRLTSFFIVFFFSPTEWSVHTASDAPMTVVSWKETFFSPLKSGI